MVSFMMPCETQHTYAFQNQRQLRHVGPKFKRYHNFKHFK